MIGTAARALPKGVNIIFGHHGNHRAYDLVISSGGQNSRERFFGSLHNLLLCALAEYHVQTSRNFVKSYHAEQFVGIELILLRENPDDGSAVGKMIDSTPFKHVEVSSRISYQDEMFESISGKMLVRDVRPNDTYPEIGGIVQCLRKQIRLFLESLQVIIQWQNFSYPVIIGLSCSSARHRIDE